MAKKQNNESNPIEPLSISDRLGAGCKEMEVNSAYSGEDHRGITSTGLGF